MSAIPSDIPNLGDVQIKVRQNPNFAPGADFGTDDYFVWSRCDGSATMHEIILMVGFETDRTVAILQRLRGFGALLLPGETQPPAPQEVETSAEPDELSQSGDRKAGRDTAFERDKVAQKPRAEITLSGEEKHAMELDVEISKDQRTRILEFRREIVGQDLFAVLGVDNDADRRTIKRAYFRLSKEFHPDLHHRKELGIWGEWLNEAFQAVTGAFSVIGDNRQRAAYEAKLRGSTDSEPQTKEEHAQALFQNACDNELQGNTDQALKLFAASIRLDEKPRFLKRAAMCAVHARKLSEAEDYAKKAAHLRARDASYWRVLADVYRAAHNFEEARNILEKALALDTENDVLFGELESDLAAVMAEITERQNDETQG